MYLKDVLEKHRGIGPGFDFLRVGLATLIVLSHSILLTGNRAFFDTTLFWFFEYALVPMFFALSGFLITGSGLRLSLGNFLINRGLRIVPALAVDIFVCALVIGPLVTTVPLSTYFTDIRFYQYSWNIIGYIHYYLPGVFETNPTGYVNGALWTVPYEIFCYILASFFIVAGWFHKRWHIAGAALVMMLGAIAAHKLLQGNHVPQQISGTLDFLLASREAQIVTAFLLGVVAFQWKDRIPYDYRLFAVCIAVCVLAAFMPELAKRTSARLVLLPALTYITVFIGLTEVPLHSYFKRGDYSYGIYLYHDPFLQCVILLFPAIASNGMFGPAFVFAIGYPMVLGIAYLSWHLIEKRILALRKKFSFVARVRDLGENATKAGPVGDSAVNSAKPMSAADPAV